MRYHHRSEHGWENGVSESHRRRVLHGEGGFVSAVATPVRDSVLWSAIADLGDSQTLELDGGLSTFGAHLKGLQRILDTANDDSLILLDEPEAAPIRRGRGARVAVLNALSVDRVSRWRRRTTKR